MCAASDLCSGVQPRTSAVFRAYLERYSVTRAPKSRLLGSGRTGLGYITLLLINMFRIEIFIALHIFNPLIQLDGSEMHLKNTFLAMSKC